MNKSKAVKRATIRQDIFCREFTIDLNGKDAAIKAGTIF